MEEKQAVAQQGKRIPDRVRARIQRNQERAANRDAFVLEANDSGTRAMIELTREIGNNVRILYRDLPSPRTKYDAYAHIRAFTKWLEEGVDLCKKVSKDTGYIFRVPNMFATDEDRQEFDSKISEMRKGRVRNRGSEAKTAQETIDKEKDDKPALATSKKKERETVATA